MCDVDIDGFWRLIEGSARARGGRPGRERWLTTALRRLGREEIEDFEIRLQESRDRIDNTRMWAAADVIVGGCSTDGFWYFQCWLIGLGRDVFERVAADPDALASLPAVRRLAGRPDRAWTDDEWPEWESLAYVAEPAYTALTGDDQALWAALEARGAARRFDPRVPDWDQPLSFPRLEALFSPRREVVGGD
jgi:hypothetical protein